MPDRQRLPNRRLAETFEFTVASLHYTCTYGRFADGRIGELFVSNHKADSSADVNARDAAVVCSIALQYGVPLGVIAESLMRDSNGKANGPLGAALDILANV